MKIVILDGYALNPGDLSYEPLRQFGELTIYDRTDTEDEAIARVIRMVKEQKVTTITGKDISIQADSVCVHGDGEKALLFVEKIRKAMAEEGITISPLKDICN